MERGGYRNNNNRGRGGNRGGRGGRGGNGNGGGGGGFYTQTPSTVESGGRGRGFPQQPPEWTSQRPNPSYGGGGRGTGSLPQQPPEWTSQRPNPSYGGGGGRGTGSLPQQPSEWTSQRPNLSYGGGGGRGSGSLPQQPSEWTSQRPNPSYGGGGRGTGSLPQQPPERSSPRPDPSYGGGGRGTGSPNPPTPRPDQPRPQPRPLPHTNIERLNISDSDNKGEKISPVHRPDNGGTIAIRTTRLRVNHFAVTFNPQTIINHYNVDVKPKLPPKQGRPPKKISKSDLSLVRDKLFADHPQTLPLKMTGYDGEKNIVSAVPLPEETFTVDISHGEDEKPVSYVVTLTLVNKLEFRKLRDYLSGSVLSIPRDVLYGMDLVVKENPAKRTVSLGRCYYPTNPPLVDNDLGHGIIAIGGFQHSLKPTSQGLAMCLDYSVLSFRKKLSVLDFLAAHIDGFNLAGFWNYKRQVEEALIGLKVNVTHRRTKQKYTIAKLTDREIKHITFPLVDLEGRNPPTDVSLVAYFKDKHGVDIKHKDIPALQFGGNKMNYVPMELCVLVEGQRFPKEYLDKNASRTLKDMSLARPWDREALIQRMMKSSDGPCGGGILQNFGMNVNTTMTSVTGRVIGAPKLKLGDPTGKITSMTVDPEKCHWNLVGKSMVVGKSVECWGILDFTSQGPNWAKLKGTQFVWKLIEKYRKMGINMEEPVCYENSTMRKLGDYGSLCELLEKINDGVYKRCRRRLQFLLCVMAHKDPGYKWLKWISETKVGIVTQCCLSGNANEGKDQYLTNLSLKINAKLGGSNVELNNRLPHFEGEGHVMFIGADVNHPGSRDIDSPSIAAVVATVNWPAANRYAARVCAQEHRKEKIVNFGEICRELVACYDGLNKVRPEKIVIFRDGVSESQFHMVLTEELLDLKKVFERANYFPTITLIVAQKRHQTRLFPAGRNEGTSGGNVFPGTVVDTKIIHPFEFDFYLCSHFGSLGTSKPTHYHVLWDEHKFTSDGLQELIYNMCFTFARCTKPVSLVPPVYYADLAAYRGRLYHEAKIGVQSPYSAASSSSSSPMAFSSLSSTTSISNDPDCYKLHADVENGMFFI